MQTIIGINSPQAVKKWATGLAVDYKRTLYFNKFTGTTPNSIVHERVDLKSSAGDAVVFDLSLRMREAPTYGDHRIEGKEEALRFLQDEVRIDQMRKSVSSGGRMSRKRGIHDLRALAKSHVSEYCAEWMDEAIICYLSGTEGGISANADSTFDISGFAGNPIQAPDAAHLVYGGLATGKGDLAATDKMSVNLVERLATRTATMGAEYPGTVNMKPIRTGAKQSFVLLMHPYQAFDLRTSTDAGNWFEITKAAGREGPENPIFTGEMGQIAGISLHTHTNVRLFKDYGAGQNVTAARALLLGAQAATIAYGGNGTANRMTWVEKSIDYDNELGISAGMIVGVKKTRYRNAAGEGSDYGVTSVDTAAKAV